MKRFRIDPAIARHTLAPATACAVVLAGGRGTRIQHLFPNVPKPFIPAAGLPFVAWVLRHLAAQGIRRAVVSLGHQADVAQKSLAKCRMPGLRVDTVTERTPLGTAGAMLLGSDAVPDADPIVVVNGDSLVPVDYAPVWRLLQDSTWDGVILGVSVADASRYGRLEVGKDDRLLAFREKQSGQGLVNAGVYFLRRRLLGNAPRGRSLSMETDFLPGLLSAGARLAVTRTEAEFLDIGTPQSVVQASSFVTRLLREEART